MRKSRPRFIPYLLLVSLVVFSFPTNILVESAVSVPAPVSTPHGGTYDGPVDLSFANSYSSGIVRYTIDGSDPTLDSPMFVQAAVESGYAHSLVLRSDGTVWSTGWNSSGQLGNDTVTSSTEFVQVQGLEEIVQIDAGFEFSIALDADGYVWTWGDNVRGQLGDGTHQDGLVAKKVPGLSGIKSISAGWEFVLCLTTSGALVGWGATSAGQLLKYSYLDNYSTPFMLDASGYTDISAGGQTCLAVTTDQTIMTWGAGPLGDGTASSRSYMVPIGNLFGIEKVYAGYGHSAAIKTDGTVLVWGYNSFGQLGLGDTVNHLAPVVLPGIKAKSVSLGSHHTAVLGQDGKVWTFGRNYDSPIGNGNSGDVYSPFQVPFDEMISALSCGDSFTVALMDGGRMYGWGLNSKGQLGVEPNLYSNTPVNAATGQQMSDVSMDGSFVLARSTSGQIWSWGDNSDLQLGVPDIAYRSVPLRLEGLADVKDVQAGALFSRALKLDGTVWTWGNNWSGNLGDGSRTNRWEPKAIKNLANIVALSGGSSNSLALRYDGTLWAWGSNYYGELGIGSTYDSAVPVQVWVIDDATKIAAGEVNGYAIRADGSLWAWGNNEYGQLGQGIASTTISKVPMEVQGISDVVEVIAGGRFVLARTADGTVYGWGDNGAGPLGSLTDSLYSVPTIIPEMKDCRLIFAGNAVAAFIDSDGSVWGAGANYRGRLGGTQAQYNEGFVRVEGLPAMKFIDFGGENTVGIDLDGAVWVIGDNLRGQLGDGTAANNVLLPMETTSPVLPLILQGADEEIVTVKARTFLSTGETSPLTTEVFEFDLNAPIITGVEEGKVYPSDRTIVFNEGVANINAIPIDSGYVVTAEGAYVLTVEDEVGHKTTVHFSVDKTPPAVLGVESGVTYHQSLTISFDHGAALLNASPFISGDTVSSEGGYTLVVTDDAGNTITLAFSLTRFVATFSSGGGSGVETQKVWSGATLTEPSPPTRVGYAFAGWYKDAGFSTIWAFATDTVGADTTLYAKWTPNTYAVTYDSAGGSAIATKNADYGTTITAPVAPTRVNYVFAGWFTALSGGSRVTFPYTVTGSATFRAHWLAAPSSVTATSAGYDRLSLTWTAVPDTSGYEVWRSSAATGVFALVSPADLATSSWLNTGLVFNTTYFYKIRAFVLDGAARIYGPYSAVAFAKPLPGTTALSAVSTGYVSIGLTWTAVTGASGYEVGRATAAAGTYTILNAGTTALALSSAALVTNTTYYYRVRAYRLVGLTKVYGVYSAVASAKPVPATPAATAISSGYASIGLSWTAVTGATGYEVSRATAAAGAYTVLTAGTAALTFSSTGLSTGLPYFYKVRAYRLVGTTKVYGALSTAASATPIPSTSTVTAASGGFDRIGLSWVAVIGATGYEVSISTAVAGTYTVLSNAVATNAYTATALATNTSYFFKVRAYRLVGTTKVYGASSAAATAKPIPSSPASPKAVSGGYNTIAITWTAVSGATGYEVWRATTAAGTYALVSPAGLVTNAFSHSGVTFNTTYYYKVRAYRLVVATKVYGGYSAVVSAKALPGTTTLKATAGVRSAALSWTAVSGASGYEVGRATSAAGTYTILTAGTIALTYNNTSLTTGTTYYFRVRAYRLVGTTKVYGAYCVVVSAKP